MTSRHWLVTATPPTPNGDLHVGHVAGPYLAADVFRRTRESLGDSTTYVCYGDDNQSYVVTTARRLDVDPNALMRSGNADIAKTLAAYDIEIDGYTRPDDEHAQAVGEAIRFLIDRGMIVEKSVSQLHDATTGEALYESLVGGRCPTCCRPTRGGICESCGHPNDPVDLLEPAQEGGDGKAIELRVSPRLVLPIEQYREELERFYEAKRGQWRPHLVALVDELLRAPLADYPISHPSDWGIPVGRPGWEGHAVNVWAEMGIGLLHAASQRDVTLEGCRYAQFLGFDNSYFFAIVHPVLQLALQRAGVENTKVPDYVFTNEFLNLDNSKFSTSQGHAIWGRDLLRHMSSDEARFVLSLGGPELAQSNFVLTEAMETVERRLKAPLRKLATKLSTLPSDRLVGGEATRSTALLENVRRRSAFFSEPENFSSSSLAEIVGDLLNHLATMEVDPKSDNAIDEYLSLLDHWRRTAAIFMPRLGARLNGPGTQTAGGVKHAVIDQLQLEPATSVVTHA